MDIVLEQFIASDKPKTKSNIMKNISIGFLVIGIIVFFVSIIIFAVFELIALGFFLGSYLAYVDYEYELYNENITITKVFNASRRKVAKVINRNQVKRVYKTEKNNISKEGIEKYYNNNTDGLEIYTFELNHNKVIQLALNSEFQKYVKIIYGQATTF